MCLVGRYVKPYSINQSSLVRTLQTSVFRTMLNRTQGITLYTVSKNVPPLTCYNLYIHGSTATIFGINVAEKVGNQNVPYFPTSPN